MKNIIWNIIVTILLIIAIVGDVQMAKNTQKDFWDKINKQQQIINFQNQNVLINEIKREGI